MVTLWLLSLGIAHSISCHQLPRSLSELEATVVTEDSLHGVSLISGWSEGQRVLNLVRSIKSRNMDASYKSLGSRHMWELVPVLEAWFRDVEIHTQTEPYGPADAQFQKRLSEFRAEKLKELRAELEEARKKALLDLDNFNRLALFGLILTSPVQLAQTSPLMDLRDLDRSIALYGHLQVQLRDPSLSMFPAFYGTALARDIVQLLGVGMFQQREMIFMPVKRAELGLLPLDLLVTLGVIPISVHVPAEKTPFRYGMHDAYHFARKVSVLRHYPNFSHNFLGRISDWQNEKISSSDFALDIISINMHAFEFWANEIRYFNRDLKSFAGGAPLFENYGRNPEAFLGDVLRHFEELSKNPPKNDEH